MTLMARRTVALGKIAEPALNDFLRHHARSWGLQNDAGEQRARYSGGHEEMIDEDSPAMTCRYFVSGEAISGQLLHLHGWYEQPCPFHHSSADFKMTFTPVGFLEYIEAEKMLCFSRWQTPTKIQTN